MLTINLECVCLSFFFFFFLQVEGLFILELHPRAKKGKKENRSTLGIFGDVLRLPLKESHRSHNNIQVVGKRAASSEDCIYLHLGCL